MSSNAQPKPDAGDMKANIAQRDNLKFYLAYLAKKGKS